jgi:predicted DNA-binding transcriptional regulator AlpA
MADPEDLMGLTEIAELLGLSRQRTDQLARQVGFPAPVATLTGGRIWKRDDVERWARETGRLK